MNGSLLLPYVWALRKVKRQNLHKSFQALSDQYIFEVYFNQLKLFYRKVYKRRETLEAF